MSFCYLILSNSLARCSDTRTKTKQRQNKNIEIRKDVHPTHGFEHPKAMRIFSEIDFHSKTQKTLNPKMITLETN